MTPQGLLFELDEGSLETQSVRAFRQAFNIVILQRVRVSLTRSLRPQRSATYFHERIMMTIFEYSLTIIRCLANEFSSWPLF